ncbi:MAG: tRNA uridine-5-carboxymethylaminomethyl(34) synthesis GTPase MnmE [Spirochaetes bacterium]|nr:MAG: tRNA uridine-5-carboxymethylaminomethyl(34) synthesis GTPase MnmE [Spirochaetota bacterium]
MENVDYNFDEPIAALATPWGQSALAVIRTSGTGCIEKIAGIFSNRENLLRAPGYTLVHGNLFDPQTRESVDELIAAVYRAPRSYTGEDSVELFAHGSLPGIQRILEVLFKVGFRQAEPGEFTLRAFLNRKMDLTRAEAVNEIVTAKSYQAQSMALNRLSGAVESRINRIKGKLIEIMSMIELQLDYPEDEAESISIDKEEILKIGEDIKKLAETYKIGRIFQEGISIAITGKTNSGKSSLFNLFLKEDRAIVSEVHGTTRDYIESWVTVKGIPIRLYDTAGLRNTDNFIEMEGIRRTQRIVENANIVLYLVDGIEGITPEDEHFLISNKNGRCVLIWNKIDIVSDKKVPHGFIPLSARTGEGLHTLESEIFRRALGEAAISSSKPVIDSIRQKNLLEKCLHSLENIIQGIENNVPLDVAAVDMREALDALGEITGEVTSTDILNSMFSRFCVGK